MLTLGLDIGTTTVCAVVLDTASGDVLKTVTQKNTAALSSPRAFERLQDAAALCEAASALVDALAASYPLGGICVTGQMHGIVYLDKSGTAVSPLYTWQDGSGEQPCDGTRTFAQALSARTGYPLATGFGAVTHFAHVCTGRVPQAACGFCTIHDYVAMRLCGRATPLLHASDAASLGLFSLKNGAFDADAIRKGGMNPDLFPPVGGDYAPLGKTAGGVPVFSAIGDNQASFLGAVPTLRGAVLVNVGTGSQISVGVAGLADDPVMETRPCVEGVSLLVGSSLCGGRAYALLEQFCRTVVTEAGFPCDSMYAVLDRLSADAETLENPLAVSTVFCGTRRDPQARGSIANLGTDNFTPRHFAAGVLAGMADELYALYAGSAQHAVTPTVLCGAGNSIRRGEVLRHMLEQRFGLPLTVPKHTEEAACGAALCAAVGAGAFPDMASALCVCNQ